MSLNHRFFLALAIFFTVVFATAPSAKAEHIFFDAAINGVNLVSQTPTQQLTQLNPQLFLLGADNTIISSNGNFTFTFNIFNTSRFGDGATLNVSFSPNPGTTLPPPLNQSFNYNGSGTQQQPVIFSFTQPYGPGVFSGFMNLELLSFQTDQGPAERELRNFELTLISSPIPEPATMVLLGTGLAGLAAGIRRRKNSPREKS